MSLVFGIFTFGKGSDINEFPQDPCWCDPRSGRVPSPPNANDEAGPDMQCDPEKSFSKATRDAVPLGLYRLCSKLPVDDRITHSNHLGCAHADAFGGEAAHLRDVRKGALAGQATGCAHADAHRGYSKLRTRSAPGVLLCSWA